MTPHNEAKNGEIAKVVIMPGDPLRAKYIADNFLDDCKLVNSVRNMYAYTGEYQGKVITVMASGMGMPSMGIYCYELYKFYGVDTIIRIGSAGAYEESMNLLDIVLAKGSFTTGNFALNFNNENINYVLADEKLNNLISNIANEKSINIKEENIACTECFDPYIEDISKVIERFPKDKKIVAAEMESFALFYTAKALNKKAACLLTIVDSIKKKESLSAQQREQSLNAMIGIALDTAIKLT